MADRRPPVKRVKKAATPAKKASSRKVGAARVRVERVVKVHDGFLETLARKSDTTRLTVFEQARLAQALVVERSQPKPPSWPELSKRYGVSARRLMRLHSKVVQESEMHHDPTGALVLEDTLRMYEEMLQECARLAADADQTTGSVGALRLMNDLLTARLSLLSGMGLMPRSFRAADELMQAQRLVRGFVELLEHEGIPSETIEKFLGLIDMERPIVQQREPRALPAG